MPGYRLGNDKQPRGSHDAAGQEQPAPLQAGRTFRGAQHVRGTSYVAVDDRRQVGDDGTDVGAVVQVEPQDRSGAGELAPVALDETWAGDGERLRRRVVDEIERGTHDPDDRRLTEWTCLPRVERHEPRQGCPHPNLEPVLLRRPLVDHDLRCGTCAGVAPRQQHRRPQASHRGVVRSDQRESGLSQLHRRRDDHHGVRSLERGDAPIRGDPLEDIWARLAAGERDDVGQPRRLDEAVDRRARPLGTGDEGE